MLDTKKDFIKELLTEASSESIADVIKSFKLPELLSNVLTRIYINGEGIKTIAYDLSKDERTIKRYHKEALELSRARLKALILLSLT